MKKLSTLICRNDLIKGFATVSVMIVVFWMASFTAFAATGTVKNNDVVIRKETSTESEKVGSVTKGKQIEILEAVKDSAGTVWYKVSLSGGGYGYIRSDLVETSETIAISANTSTASESGSASAPETVPTSIGEQQAVIKSEKNVNVRSGASTQHATVTTLPNGTPVTLIGEANDSGGNKWYQITCSYNGRTIEGYVRRDLLEIGETGNGGEGNLEGEEGNEGGETGQEGAEGEYNEGTPEEGSEDMPAQQPIEQQNDYGVMVGSDGSYYLCDYNAGEKGEAIPIDYIYSILEKVDSPETIDRLESQVKNEKIIIIILAVVIVIMFIVLTILLFKIKDLYYDYEEDEEEEEEEEEPVPVKKKKPAPSRAEEKPVRSGKPQAREEKELYAAQQREPAKKPTTRKPQNFLIDDDEFEFEFLNMDDKDL